jgi:hypothetical protein
MAWRWLLVLLLLLVQDKHADREETKRRRDVR